MRKGFTIVELMFAIIMCMGFMFAAIMLVGCSLKLFDMLNNVSWPAMLAYAMLGTGVFGCSFFMGALAYSHYKSKKKKKLLQEVAQHFKKNKKYLEDLAQSKKEIPEPW